MIGSAVNDKDSILKMNQELRQHLRAISFHSEFESAFSAHKTKLMCISSLFRVSGPVIPSIPLTFFSKLK